MVFSILDSFTPLANKALSDINSSETFNNISESL